MWFAHRLGIYMCKQRGQCASNPDANDVLVDLYINPPQFQKYTYTQKLDLVGREAVALHVKYEAKAFK